MMEPHVSLFNRLYGPQLPLEERQFNIIFLFGFIMGFSGMLTCITIHSSYWASLTAGVMTILVVGMWVLGHNLPKYRTLLINLTLVGMNLFVLPALYLSGGSIHSGISAYFALALALTYTMYQGRLGLILVILQILYDLVLYGFSYRFSDMLPQFPALFYGNHWFEHVAIGSNVLMVALALSVLARVFFGVFRQEDHNTEEAIMDMARMAELDSLTGLYNRRALYTNLKGEISRSRRREIPLCAILLDIDDFKYINDSYGHLTGDEVLRNLSTFLRDRSTGRITVYRFGGEEFVLVLPETDKAEAMAFAEQLRTDLKKTRLSETVPEDQIITASFGVARFDPEKDGEALINEADEHMYQAKEHGKDQVVG